MDESSMVLLAVICCGGIAGAFVIAVITIWVTVLWSKKKKGAAPSKKDSASQAQQRQLPQTTSEVESEQMVSSPSLQEPTSSEPPSEAVEHLERAINIEVEEGDVSALQEQAAELALAIKKANGIYPHAHAVLGVVMSQLGDEKRARRELNLAIQQENCNTLARAVLILMDMDRLGVGPTVRTGSWFDLLVVGGEVAAATLKVGNLSSRISELARAYPIDISESSKVDYWINASELMLQVHDAIQDIRRLSRKDRLARAVLNAPWERIDISPEDQERVNDLKRRAEGRVLLSKM